MARTNRSSTLTDFRRVPRHLRGLLGRRIKDFDLRIETSRLQPFIDRLGRELRQRGLRHFRPIYYLGEEWCCVDRYPVIGLPFYLADRRLARIEAALRGYLEDEREIMMFLRHEAGHAFNYAYRLYRTPAWRRLFGPFGRAYLERFPFDPTSQDFVRHLANHYAQKHPDEDFAETFAVWLTPGSRWRRRYATGAVRRKLDYVERQVQRLGSRPPLVTTGTPDHPADRIGLTLRQFYARERQRNNPIIYGHWSWTDPPPS